MMLLALALFAVMLVVGHGWAGKPWLYERADAMLSVLWAACYVTFLLLIVRLVVLAWRDGRVWW